MALEILRLGATAKEADGSLYIPAGNAGDNLVPTIQALYSVGDDWNLDGSSPFVPFDWDKFSLDVAETPASMTMASPWSAKWHDYGYEDIRVYMLAKSFATIITAVLQYLSDTYSLTTLSQVVKDLQTLVSPTTSLNGLFDKNSWLFKKWSTLAKVGIQALVNAVTGTAPFHVALAGLQQVVTDLFPAQLSNGVQVSLWQNYSGGGYVKKYLKYDESMIAGWLDAFSAEAYNSKAKYNSSLVVNPSAPQ
jgi:hypothetical protein